MSKQTKYTEEALDLSYPWYPHDLVVNEKGLERKNSYDITKCLIEVFYRSGAINTATYMEIKKHLKNGGSV